VQFHGDFGPGGGFQAGVIFASAFVLYALIYGVDKARAVISDDILRIGIGLGVLIYGGTGVVSLFLGANYLDYSPLASDAPHGQHIGIFAVELGVGITVASVMATIFFQFAGRAGADEEED
jgi:multicomponent Na+:H+ antiporter subunit B